MTVKPILYDNHHRPLNYLRLAVTDRCNLRCFYCMPEEGIKYLPKQALLTYEEMERLVRIMAKMGINKVRITGGEPFVRNNLVEFLGRISEIEGIDDINITTNGVLTAPYIPVLKQIGVKAVNLSLDTLDRQNFLRITRRDEFEKVMQTFYQLLEHDIAVKINAVVMEGKNDHELLALASLTKDFPVAVRFIEEMPFNGEGSHYPALNWNHARILETLKAAFPEMERLPAKPAETAYNYQLPGHQGTVGIIAAFSRTFCGTCNRIRLTAQGGIKTCLYDEGVLDLKAMLRRGASDEEIQEALLQAFSSRAKDGWEAESRRTAHNPVSESMSSIGG